LKVAATATLTTGDRVVPQTEFGDYTSGGGRESIGKKS
jgi:hypothetical protein